MVSGSWPGQIFMFPGGEDGWLARKELADGNGKALHLESASSVAVTDWDRDGDLDLIVGHISGPVVLYPNVSENGTLAFGDSRPLKAAGEKIEAHDGGPCVADWDLDGDDDLIVGLGDGSVVLYRAEIKEGKSKPSLAKAEVLCSGNGRGAGQSMRAKPCVADWNSDGRPDLLVGDFGSSQKPDPDLTEEQKARKKELQQQQNDISKRLMDAWKGVDEKAKKAIGLAADAPYPKERAKEYSEALQKVMEEDQAYKLVMEDMQKIQKELQPLQGGWSYHGHVWLYLRK